MKVCEKCFDDIEIKQFIHSVSTQTGKCECCSETGAIIDVVEILDFFSEFVKIFKFDKQGTPLIELIQEDWKIFSSIETGTQFLSIKEVSESIKSLLEIISANFALNAEIPVSYIDEINESVSFWDSLKNDLKYKRRFLTDIRDMEEYGWDAMFNVFVSIDNRNSLFRARINNNGATNPYPKDNMGAPQKELSTSGRANPQGIPYLYLSRNLETTLYEARASFLDYISIGVFKIKPDYQAKLVDFTFRQSPFNFIDTLVDFTKAKLLREKISLDLSKPLRRFDSELEYIPTQFICEYIRFFTGADGIQFYSSLEKQGINVVLFSQENIECVDVEVHQITEVKIESKKVE